MHRLPGPAACWAILGLSLLAAAILPACGPGNGPCAACDGGNSNCGCIAVHAGPIIHVQDDCAAAATPTTCRNGDRCLRDDDFPTGNCSSSCDPKDAGSCDYGSICVGLADGPFCSRICQNNIDCPPTATCVSGLPNLPYAVCVENELDGGDASGLCPTTFSVLTAAVDAGNPGAACLKPIVTPLRLTNESLQSLGNFTVGSTATFNVPPNTVALSIYSQAVDAGDNVIFQGFTVPNSAVPTLLTEPGGTVLYNDVTAPLLPLPPALQNVYYGGLSPSTGTMTIPNTQALLESTAAAGSLPAGTWSMQVNDFAYECSLPNSGCDAGASTTNLYNVSVVTKAGPKPASGTLDVAIYLASLSLGPAQTLVTNTAFSRMLDDLRILYARAGVCLGTVTVYDLPSWAQQQYYTVNVDSTAPCSPLDQMFTLAKPGNRLNLFLVDNITATGQPPGYSIVGIDGTIPGPAGASGTISSGAAVNASDLTAGGACGFFNPFGCGPDEVAFIAAHEGGHFLGLYHTTEATGESFDPLLDTAACKCELCTAPGAVSGCYPNGSTMVTGNTCVAQNAQCGGGDDLMFWLLSQTSKGTLTDDQGQVMRNSSAVY